MLEMSENIKSNAKRFWIFCRRTKYRLLPAALSSGSEEAISPEDKSTMFNNHFYSVFNNNTSDSNFPEVNIRINSNLSHIVFSEKDVFLVLKRLDINKGISPNVIPLRVPQGAAELTPSLTTLFNMCMSTCTLPDAWPRKHVYVVPLYKKEINVKLTITDPFHCLITVNGVSKIMERLVFNHVHHYVYPMINSVQHGFKCWYVLQHWQEYGRRHTDRHYFSWLLKSFWFSASLSIYSEITSIRF